MSNFKVGDRVRLVRKPPRPTTRKGKGSILGRQVTIIGPRPPCSYWPEGGYFLCVDGHGLIATDGGAYWALACQLEPILPTPLADDILAAKGLPEFEIRAPGVAV